ncbi:MAG: EAL domain-containing protein [Methylococcaceae bacterium]|nr:MAG: EAL domain-containing protein [Methylococcaceae bacterium]
MIEPLSLVSTSAAAPAPAVRRHSVMLVDENVTRCVQIQQLLEQGGFSVVAAATTLQCGVEPEHDGFSVAPADALEQIVFEAEKYRPDFLLLDADLRVTDGYRLCRELRNRHVTSGIPVLMMVNADDSRAIDLAFQAEATDFICKPLEWSLLAQRVRYMLRTSRLANALKDSEKRYSLALCATNDGLWDWNLESGEVFYSARWKQILGLTDDETEPTANAWLGRVHPDQRNRVEELVTRHLKGHTSHFFCEYQLRHKHGHYLWVLSRGIAERDEQRKPIRFTGSLSNIDARKQAEQRLQFQANYDDLTGLANRHLLLHSATQMLADSRREGRRCALIYLDLAHFKTIKSSLGLAFSNQFLQKTAERLAAAIPKDALAGRYERDEFVILLPNIADHEQALQHAQTLMEALCQPCVIDGMRVHSGASLGLVIGPEGYEDAEYMVRDADTAVGYAKNKGGNCCEVFNRSMYEEARVRLECESAIQQGLVDEQFLPFFQPVIALKQQRLAGFEALMRWARPGHGIVAPAQFLEVAESSGKIVALGESIFRQACRQTRAWLDVFPDNELIMHINLSGRQFIEPRLSEWVLEVLQETALPSRHLGVEITETALIEKPQLAHDILRSLHRQKVHLSIDDFGAGYSSLSYLQQFPFDVLKIDRSFTSAIVQDKKSADIVQAVIKLAHKLKLQVVAEGIETEQEAELLTAWRCDYGQGYLYAPPLAADVALGWVAQGRGVSG